jgi:diacylglycerol kinase (ATP)
MAGIGIVSNPRSRRNLRAPETAARLARLVGGAGELREVATPQALAEALDAFRRAGVQALAVNGGDGTLHQVVTALDASWGPTPWPLLMALRGGTMSTVARVHGTAGRPERVVQRLLEELRAGREPPAAERDLLAVEGEGLPRRCGFLFGTGLAVRFLEAWYAGGHPSWRSALGLFLRAAGSAVIRGKLARALARPVEARVAGDGQEWPADTFLAVLAGAVPEVGFGLAPLARCGEQPGFFHAVGVTGAPLQLALRLPAVWLGRPWRRPLALDAVVRRLELDGPPGPFTLDGDLYGAQGRLAVRAGPVARLALGRGHALR